MRLSQVSRLQASWAILLILACAGATSLGAQLSGNYTCANNNPGNAFDYGDIGDFFDDLEALGVSGPVALEVFDTGGNFISNESYLLGGQHIGNDFFFRPIGGLGAANNLTISAAPGHRPELTGMGALGEGSVGRGALGFINISYTTVLGLTITGGPGDGIFWQRLHYTSGPHPATQFVRIANCRIHDRTQWSASGWGIRIRNSYSDTEMHNFVIENNMIWNCEQAAVESDRSGLEWVVRHNTVVQPNQKVAFYPQPGVPWSVFENNIIHVTNSHAVKGTLPINVDGNVVYLGGGSYVSSVHTTWQDWQASGRDLNGLNADPLLVNITPGFEDLRLSAASPARDLMPSSSVTEDIFGNPRPMGAGCDSGAHEYPVGRIEVEYQAVPVLPASQVNVGDVHIGGESRTFTIRNPHAGDLSLTGVPPVVFTPGFNIGAATNISNQPALTTLPANTDTDFQLYIEPVGPGSFQLDISIDNSDQQNNPYTFTIIGTAVDNAAARATAVSGFGGPMNGPFTLAVDPGGTVQGEIELSDLEGDPITVTGIFPPANAPPSIIPPAIPAPGQPLSLVWGGTADASSAPGSYIWNVQFADSVNGSTITALAILTINKSLFKKPVSVFGSSGVPSQGV